MWYEYGGLCIFGGVIVVVEVVCGVDFVGIVGDLGWFLE